MSTIGNTRAAAPWHLWLVGILTLPLEAKYFGWRVSILRNALSFAGALLVGLLMGISL